MPLTDAQKHDGAARECSRKDELGHALGRPPSRGYVGCCPRFPSSSFGVKREYPDDAAPAVLFQEPGAHTSHRQSARSPAGKDVSCLFFTLHHHLALGTSQTVIKPCSVAENAASSNDAAGRPPQRRIPSRYQGEAAQPQGATAPPARFGDACTPVGQAPPASSLALSRQDGRFSSQPFTSLDSLQRAQQQQQQQLPTQRTIPPVHHTATQLAERVRSSAAASTSGASATSMEGLSQSLGLSRRGTPPAPPVLSGVPVERARLTLRDLLAERNIVLRSYSPGQQNHLPCPQCQGGDSKEKQFSILISDDGNSASWRCFRGSCGFSGGVSTAEPGRSRSGD